MLPFPLSSENRSKFLKGLGLFAITTLIIAVLLNGIGLADTSDIIALPIIGTAIIYFAYGFYYGISGLQQAKNPFKRPEDLSSETDSSPIDETAISAVIDSLGFSLLGKLGNNQSVHTWLYIDKSEQVLLKVNSASQTSFHSIYNDGFIAETFTVKEKYISNTPMQQYKNLYNAHSKKIEDSLKEHGKPLNISNVQSWIDWEQKFGHRKTRDFFLQHALWWGGFLLLFGPGLILYVAYKFPLSKDIKSLLSALPISFFPLAVISFVKSSVFGKTREELMKGKPE